MSPNLVCTVCGMVSDFSMVARYLVTEGELPLDTLLTLQGELGPAAKEIMAKTAEMLGFEMTTADMLRAEGYVEGYVKQYKRGYVKGLLKVLALRFGPLPEVIAQRVRAAEVEQLEVWAERVFTAATVDEALA